MKGLKRRLHVLEASQAARIAAGCETCRHWHGYVLLDDDGHATHPEQCPACGRATPWRQLIHLVGVPVDAL